MRTHFFGALCVTAGLMLAACGEEAPPPAPPAPAPGAGAPSTASVAQAVTVQAQKLLDETTQYIKDKKWDLAEKALKQLEEMKPNLPPEYGPRIDTLRSSFNAAKGGLSLPK